MAGEGTTYKRARIKGIGKVRKLLNRLEPEEKAGVQNALRMGAESIEADAIGLALQQDIRRTGDMIASISIKYSRDRMTAVIGPGADRIHNLRNNPWNTTQFRGKRDETWLVNMEAQWNMMKAYWAEFGTGPPVPQDPQPFMNPAWDYNAAVLRQRVNKEVVAAIKRAASSAGSE